MVSVEDDWNAIGWSDGANVVGGGNGTGDGGFLALVVESLAGEVGSATLGELEDDRSLCVFCGFESSDGGGGRGNIDGRDSVVVLLGVLEELCSMPSAIDMESRAH